MLFYRPYHWNCVLLDVFDLKLHNCRAVCEKTELKQRQRRSILCEMTAEEDIPSSFAHSVPPSFSLIYINNWGLSRKRHMVRKWEPSTKDFSSITAGSEEDYFYADMIWTTVGLIAGLLISSLLPWSYWLMRFLTLCPGSRWVLPVWPTTKWTSAISSLLNITEFLERERNKRRTFILYVIFCSFSWEEKKKLNMEIFASD